MTTGLLTSAAVLTETGPDFNCRLIFMGEDGVRSICSASLTGEQELTTAAHCFGKSYKSMEARCGYKGATGKAWDIADFKAPNKELPENTSFSEVYAFTDAEVSAHYAGRLKDFAKIMLPKKSKLKPLAKATEDDLKKFFSSDGRPVKDLQCSVAGFGMTNNFTMGFLRSMPMDMSLLALDLETKSIVSTVNKDVSEREHEACLIVTQEMETGLQNMYRFVEMLANHRTEKWTVGKGDSGGPLYCKLGSEDEWKQVGITIIIGADLIIPGLLSMTTQWNLLPGPNAKFQTYRVQP
jgi:Trypsin